MITVVDILQHGQRTNFANYSGKQAACIFNIYCTVISLEDYAKMRIYSIKRNFSINEFVNLMLHFAQEINAKDETIQWIKDCAIEFAL